MSNMLTFVVALLLYFGIVTLSLVVTYYTTVALSRSKKMPAINHTIMTQLTILLQTINNFIGDVISSLPSSAFILLNVREFLRTYLPALLLFAIFASYQADKELFLESMDKFWRCGVHPFFRNILLTVVQVARLAWGALVPIYNFNALILGQIFSGSGIAIFKCNTMTLFDSLRILLNIFISNFQSIAKWSGVNEKGMSVNNNIFTNDIDVTEVVANVQDLVLQQQAVASCVCDGLKDVFELWFILFKQREITVAINHLVNIPISLMHMFVKVAPPWSKSPSFLSTVNHINGFIYYTAKYADQVAMKMSLHILSIFDDNIKPTGLPKEFMFTVGARVLIASIQLTWTAVRVGQSFMIPVGNALPELGSFRDSDFMIRTWSLDQALEHLNIAIIGATDTIGWGFKLLFELQAVERRAMSGQGIEMVLPTHVHIVCQEDMVNDVDNLACAARAGLWLIPDTIYTLYSLLVELLAKSVINREENVIQTLQRYDGISFVAGHDLTCKYRQSISYDLTAGVCKCDPGLGTLHMSIETDSYPFGRPYYDRYCGQPNLQVNLFGNVAQTISYATAFFSDNLKDVTVSLSGAVVELAKVAIKTTLNVENIVSGDYFSYKRNCGYGMSSKQLRAWFNGTDDSTTLVEKVQRQRLLDPSCVGALLPYRNTLENKVKCKLIDSTLRDMMCQGTSNPSGRLDSSATPIPTITRCQTTNHAGCECNFMLPLSDTNQCRCIRDYPDTVVEYTEKAFSNPVVDALQAASNHWCNTYTLEPFLDNVDRVARSIESIIAIFHPSYSNNVNGTNKYCENSSFVVYRTNILRYPLWRYNLDKDLYARLSLDYREDSCAVYGTSDFVCSLGLTLRSSVQLVVNEFRMVVMSMSKILEGDFTGIKLTISERLCDLQRAIGGFSSIVPSLLPDANVDVQFQKGMTQLIYSSISAMIMVLDIANHVVAFFGDLITGKLDWSSGPFGPVFKLVFGILNVAIDALKQFIASLASTLNGLETGAGDGLLEITNIIDIVQKYLLNEAALELFGLVSKVFVEIAEFFTTGTVAAGDFFTDLWSLVEKGIGMLLKQAGKLLGFLLDALGPVGTFIENFAGSACRIIEGVACFGQKDCSLGCIGGFRRHLRSDEQVVWHVAQSFAWNGTSFCDRLVHGYQSYAWSEMRPVEQIQLSECVEQRMLAREIARKLNVTLPEDIVYNWKRKWLLGKQFFDVAVVYIGHRMGHVSTSSMLSELKASGIDPKEWLPLFHRSSSFVYSIFTMSAVQDGIEAVFREFDPNVMHGTSSVSSMYRLYHIGRRASSDAYRHAVDSNIGFKLKRSYNALSTMRPTLTVPKHLGHAWHAWHASRKLSTPRTPSRSRARNIFLKAAGVDSGITPCNSRPDSYVCVNCVILDNLINVVVKDGISMTGFYRFVYNDVTVPSFVDYWTDNDDTRAWISDAGELLAAAAAKSSNDLVDTKLKETDRHRHGYDPYQADPYRLQRRRLRSGNQSVDYNRQAKADWEWFFTTNPFETHNARKPFISVLADFLSEDNGQYVQYLAHPLAYYLKKPFEDCSMDKMYCKTSTVERRQDLISDAFLYMLWVTLALYGMQYVSGVPVLSLVAPFLMIIYVFIYNYTVYEYTFTCVPSLPNCWVEDIYVYLSDKLFPSCFCTYLPGLASSCKPDSCFLCSQRTSFAQCDAAGLGVFWGFLYWIRVHYPSSYLFAYRNIPFSWLLRKYPGAIGIAQEIIDGTAPSQANLDCLSLSYIDIGIVLMGCWVASKFANAIVPITVRVIQYTLNMLFVYTTTIYSIVVSLEMQTNVGEYGKQSI